MAEPNGTGRLDRIEGALESLTSDVELLTSDVRSLTASAATVATGLESVNTDLASVTEVTQLIAGQLNAWRKRNSRPRNVWLRRANEFQRSQWLNNTPMKS